MSNKFLPIAKAVAQLSKDTTKVGAVIVQAGIKRVIAGGGAVSCSMRAGCVADSDVPTRLPK